MEFKNFLVLKDDFGLIMNSGQFNNNGIKKDKVVYRNFIFRL